MICNANLRRYQLKDIRRIMNDLRKIQYYFHCLILNLIKDKGAKIDWDFRISDLVKNPDGTDV